MVTVDMSGAVYEPGHIQNKGPAEHGGNKPSILHRFTPQVHRDQCWQNEASKWHQKQVISIKRKGEVKTNKII